jgi:N-acetylmuramoyl-L-alanine amidase
MSVKKHVLKAIILIFIILVFFHAQNSLASSTPPSEVKVLVDNQEIYFDVPPAIENGRALIPLRAIGEALGALVTWEERSKTVIMAKGNITIKLIIGNNIAYKNTEKVILDAPAKIIRDRTIVPLRFVSEALGAKVRWDSASRLININIPAEEERLGGKLIVEGDLVNIRSGPGISHDILTQVSRGTRLPALDRNADWYQVQLPGGKMGWIVSWYVKEDAAPSPASPEIPEKTGDENKKAGSEEQKESDNGQAGQTKATTKDNNGTTPLGVSIGNEENKRTEPDKQDNNKQTAIIKVTVNQENEVTMVKITSDQKIIYKIFRLRAPDRLVMDIYNVSPADLPASQNINSKAISTLRIGWFSRDPDITRLVFDLKEQALYKVETSLQQDKITLDIFIPNIKDTLKGKIIVLDPGHGGVDPGAIGQTLGLKEKDVNLEVARRAARLLNSYSAKVILTRSGDEYIDLGERTQKANSMHADLFISIHMNANSSTQLKGTSTYYTLRSKDAERLTKSRQLAGHIQNALLSTLQLDDKSIRQADFVVLRETTMPAVLIEAAFLSNPEEEKLMATEQFWENVAQAIVQGIGNYLSSF